MPTYCNYQALNYSATAKWLMRTESKFLNEKHCVVLKKSKFTSKRSQEMVCVYFYDFWVVGVVVEDWHEAVSRHHYLTTRNSLCCMFSSSNREQKAIFTLLSLFSNSDAVSIGLNGSFEPINFSKGFLVFWKWLKYLLFWHQK